MVRPLAQFPRASPTYNHEAATCPRLTFSIRNQQPHQSRDIFIPAPPPRPTRFASLTERRFFPYSFRVPTTNIVLHLGFGIIRHRIDPAELRSLLLLTKDGIQRGIDAHGPDALFPALGNDHRQQFREHGLGTVRLDISDFKAGNQFCWGDVWNVVEGLRLYLLEGGRSFETHFTFWEEPNGVSHQLHRKLGQGRVVRGSPNDERG